MTQTTIVGGLGLFVFALSTFTPTQRFGTLMLVMLAVALVGDLIMLPALLAGPLTLVLAHPREGDSGPWVLLPEQLVTMLVVRMEDGALHAALDEDALRAYLAGFSPALVIEPVDANFPVVTP